MLTALSVIALSVSVIIVIIKLNETINNLEYATGLAEENNQLIQTLTAEQLLKFYRMEKRVKDLEAWQTDLNSVFFGPDGTTSTNLP